MTERGNIEKIEEMIKKQAGEVESKIMKNVDDNHTVYLGEIEKTVVNAEHRIKQKYDAEIKKIEEELESLILKVGLGP